MIAAEASAELLAALNTLRDDDREVLGARFLLDLSEAETAEALGLPRGTVKSRTSRALARLREAFARRGGVAMSDQPMRLAARDDAGLEAPCCAAAPRRSPAPTASPSGAPDVADTAFGSDSSRIASARGPRGRWATWRPVRRGLVLALIALLALAAIAGAVGLGLPGLQLTLGEPPASPPPTRSATQPDPYPRRRWAHRSGSATTCRSSRPRP